LLALLRRAGESGLFCNANFAKSLQQSPLYGPWLAFSLDLRAAQTAKQAKRHPKVHQTAVKRVKSAKVARKMPIKANKRENAIDHLVGHDRLSNGFQS
jgi:hypothetical protein